MRSATVLLLACAAGAHAAPCPIPTRDPAAALRRAAATPHVLTSVRTDADSREPVIRNIIDFGDGTTIIVDQQNCQMENLRLTLLSPTAVPALRDLRRAGKILGQMPIWQRHYPAGKAETVFIDEARTAQFTAARPRSGFTYKVEQRLDARRATTEALVAFTSTDSAAASYGSQLSLYLGIGGQ